MKKVIEFIWEYKLEIFLSVCLFSNLYPDLPHFMYFALIGFLCFVAIHRKAKVCESRKGTTFGLISIIVFSSFVSGQIDFRFVLMSFLLLVTLGISSYGYYKLKTRFLYMSIIGFGITSILNYYASIRGINYQLIMGIHAGEAFSLDFSGYTYHPMWLSAATGVGTIFFVYLMMKLWNTESMKKWMFFMLPFVFVSFLVTVKGGSRSAAGLSILSSCLMIYIGSKKISNTLVVLMVIAIVSSFVAPIVVENSQRMQNKYGGLNLREKDGTTSRTRLWNDRIEDFESSPLWGVGFGVTGHGNKAKVGRAETGSGWLTILSQTGIVGFILALLLVKKAFLPISILREDHKLTLFFVVLIYLCLHSIFEAYMFQAGWYLCLVFWLLVSVLDDSKIYGNPDEILDEEES